MKRALFKSVFKKCYPHIYFVRNPFKMLEYRAMKQGVDFRPEDRILDVGSGHGLQTMLLAKEGGTVVGIDVSENAVNRARSDLAEVGRPLSCEFRCTPIEEAGFEDNSFDKIFSVCVLEHIPDYQSVLEHCYRVLKPGGLLSFSVDSLATIDDPDLIERHKEAYHVCRYFDPDKLRADFEGVGFTHVSIKPLATSPHAARLFAKGIETDYNFRYMQGVCAYQKLRLVEGLARGGQKGIYLLVRASK